MQALKGLFKAVSGKGRPKSGRGQPSNELTPELIAGLTRAVKFLNNQFVLPQGLYKEPGFPDEINQIEELIQSGKVAEPFLANVGSTHSIAMAIVNVLAAHDPVIPQSLYDHFMSPLANLETLIDDLIAKSPLFDTIMGHLRHVLSSKSTHVSAMDLAANVGIHMIRAVEDDAGFDSHTFESQARIKTFERIIHQYIVSKEESERFLASANTTVRRSVSLAVPTTVRDLPPAAPTHHHSISAPPSPAPPAAASPVISAGTIQERSVKIVFPEGVAKPSQDELRRLLARYGTVNNVGYKEKLAVVLFSTKAEAQACARDKDGRALGDAFKVKYLGGALDPVPPPSVAEPSSTAHVVSETAPGPGGSPSKLFQYDGGNIKHYTTFMDAQPAVVDVAKAAAEAAAEVAMETGGGPGSSPARRPSLNRSIGAGVSGAAGADAHNTSVYSVHSMGTAASAGTGTGTNGAGGGWANASRGGGVPRDASAALNASVVSVSEFSRTGGAQPRDHPANASVDGPSSINTSLNTIQAHRMSAAAAGLTPAGQVPHAVLQPSLAEASYREEPSTLRETSDVSLLRERARGVNRNDLSMVSFMGDPYEAALDTSMASSNHPRDRDAGKNHHQTERRPSGSKSLARVDENDSEETDHDRPGLRPHQAVSPVKRGSATRYQSDLTRVDSQGSSTGSWKSAQPTRSPEASIPPPIVTTTPHASQHRSRHKRGGHDGTGSDTADESPSEAEGAGVHPLRHESEETTPRRDTYPVRDLGLPESRRTSFDDTAARRSSLSSVTVNVGQARFSTDSAATGAQRDRDRDRDRDVPWASPTSTGSVGGELSESGGGSVKKRQIRTIHVSSPHSSHSHSQSQERLPSPQAADLSRHHQSSSTAHTDDASQRRETRRGSRTQDDLLLRHHEDSHHRSHHSTSPPARHRYDEFAEGSSSDPSDPNYRHRSEGTHRRYSRSDAHSGSPARDRREAATSAITPSRHATNRSSQSHHQRIRSDEHVHTSPHRSEHTDRSAWDRDRGREDSLHRQPPTDHHTSVPAPVDREMRTLVKSLQERLRLLEAQVNLSTEADTLRKETQSRLEERWATEITALNLRNQQTAVENARLQEELQKWKVECATTQAALSAAEASKRTLLLAAEDVKDRAQHEALDTVIAQKRLIASLETHLLECKRQMKTLENELGYMRDKHCTTASSLITWKAKALELSSQQSSNRVGGGASVASGGSRGGRRKSPTVEVAFQRDVPRPERSHLSVSPSEEGSVEHKDSHSDGEDHGDVALFSNISQSRIPANASALSGVSFLAHDASFPTEGGNSTVFQHIAPAEAATSEEDADFLLSTPAAPEVALEAQRKTASRTTRQYVSKLPVPPPPSSLLSASAAAAPVAAPSNPNPQHESEAFAPNPLYAALLERLNAPHPAATPLGVPIKGLPVPQPSSSGIAGGDRPVHMYLAGNTREEERNLGLMRRDLSEVAVEAGITYKVPNLRSSSSPSGPARQSQRSGAYHHPGSAAVLRRAADNAASLQRFQRETDKFTALMERCRRTADGIDRITPLLPPQQSLHSAEAKAYEQRLKEVMHAGSGLRRQTPAASYLSRSASDVRLSGGLSNVSVGGLRSHGSSTGGAHRVASSYSGGPPTWAQYKYE